ncbi:ergothioneine biosynthesis glutamate--cysteine ligase EgtA [Lapillicoccus sp.]|uniref:ergothioneine biosynthesis glutamate--cysteine ligase EgtA n=1 Tax=Lapillicoccus sp. TaxID=1909287 RepID=UPI0025CF2851|nr:ergothioneine biosynthesis glutamate--cysteine ligase EgtA [Lapillicoccus sp.]
MTAHVEIDAAQMSEDTTDDAPLRGPRSVSRAHDHIARVALTEGPIGRVGLELEMHLVDRSHPGRRPGWAQIERLVAGLRALPGGSTVTLEPGGQLELSTPPGADVVAAVTGLQRDERRLRAHAGQAGFGLAPLGSDPARPPRRVGPGARYVAMEQHFQALSASGSGLAMMTATAALQVNLDAGPAAGWDDRLGLVRSLVPVLVAISAGSPYLGARTSGWHSMRQGTWHGIDHGRTDPVRAGAPGPAWADYALAAPVMLVADDPGGHAPNGTAEGMPRRMTAMTDRVTLEQWLRGDGPIGRAPTLADVDYHLTTLFPPVRPRGYIEIRCLDSLPDRWWPSLAAIVVSLVDDPVAADLAAEICEPVTEMWEAAARWGMADPAIRTAVLACLDLAVRHAAPPLRAGVAELAELLQSGRTPSGQLRSQIERDGPLRVLLDETELTADTLEDDADV